MWLNRWVCYWKCCVPLNPMVLLIIIPTKWLFHWGYTPFSDIPRCHIQIPTNRKLRWRVAYLADPTRRGHLPSTRLLRKVYTMPKKVRWGTYLWLVMYVIEEITITSEPSWYYPFMFVHLHLQHVGPPNDTVLDVGSMGFWLQRHRGEGRLNISKCCQLQWRLRAPKAAQLGTWRCQNQLSVKPMSRWLMGKKHVQRLGVHLT